MFRRCYPASDFLGGTAFCLWLFSSFSSSAITGSAVIVGGFGLWSPQTSYAGLAKQNPKRKLLRFHFQCRTVIESVH
jgi:hypothetical protein